MQSDQLRNIVEAALLAAGRSLDLGALEGVFAEAECPARDEIKAALEDIEADCKGRGFELKRTGSGYRFQVRQELSPWIDRLWEEKPKKYSRALLETLALIAYRQPLTRGDIEQVRGVAVSSEIIRTLQDREWVRSVGHRDVPGRPALYATTRKFLDDFNLRGLGDLPPLSEIRDIETFSKELGFDTSADADGGENTAGGSGLLAEIESLIEDSDPESQFPQGIIEEDEMMQQESVETAVGDSGSNDIDDIDSLGANS